MALTRVPISPTGMRLQEWIALERGYFQAEGIVEDGYVDAVNRRAAREIRKGNAQRPPFRSLL